MRDHGPAHQEHAGEVDGEHLVPGLDGELVDRLALVRLHADAGIVDEDVDAACLLYCRRDARFDAVALGHVDRNEEMT